MRVQHFVSISGGKDSTATACLAIERAERRGFTPRFLFADTGNEHPLTLDHIDYLEGALGLPIIRVKADFAERLAERRLTLPVEWSKEKRRKSHVKGCTKKRRCDCPVTVYPSVTDDLIARAVALMEPTGVPFLDLCILKGRFPSRRAQFCTEELKVEPINGLTHPMLDAGTNVVSWIGERAEESVVRAARSPIQRIRWASGAALILYRPIHKLYAGDTFRIAARHGLKPNPLYLRRMRRVGCMPCINCAKEELVAIDALFPEHIDKIRDWEALMTEVSRRGASTFFSSNMVPALPDAPDDPTRASIDKAVEWARTDRGGRQFNILQRQAAEEAAGEGAMCESAYGLCE